MKKWTFLPVTFTWLGFLLAISFFETPLKFQAPSLSLEQGVEIGKIIFYWFNKVELAFALLLALHWVIGHIPTLQQFLIAVLVGIVVFQSLWLLPAVDDQAQLLFEGVSERNPLFHTLYVICEALKVILLIWLGRLQLKSIRKAFDT